MVVGRPAGHGVAVKPVHLAGKHCESSDILIHDANLPDPQVGDLIAVPVTGAYGHAMANNYNGQPRPPIVFVSGGTARAVVRRETYEDLTRRDL
jgi:diaminopimelate decarboxylase